MNAKFGTLNVHRADCNRHHPNPCDPWRVRGPRVADFIRRQMRCSAYAFQECLPEQAIDLTTALGWGTSKNPAWWSDENFNVVALDRTKWTDIDVREVSLWAAVGGKGDRNRRSAIWLRALHLETGVEVMLGSSHLETGDPEARATQADKLARSWPCDGDTPTDAVLGIDRNSYTLAPNQPRDILNSHGIWEAIPDCAEGSFNGFGKPSMDGKSIDGLHYTGPRLTVSDTQLVSSVGLVATDHSGLTTTITIGDLP